jgi:hypothetical protein
LLQHAANVPRHQLQQSRAPERSSGGYNAALIAELVGSTGSVTTVDMRGFAGAGNRCCFRRLNRQLAAARGDVSSVWVSYMRVATTNPEAAVRAAIVQVAARMP